MQATQAAQAVQNARDFKSQPDSETSPDPDAKPDSHANNDSAAKNDNADPFLANYFRRIDPKTAESFNEEQRAAIRTMFASRDIAKHAVEVRQTLGFGRKRFYLIFLLGRERRAYERDGRSPRRRPQGFSLALYLALSACWLVPGFLLAKVIG